MERLDYESSTVPSSHEAASVLREKCPFELETDIKSRLICCYSDDTGNVFLLFIYFLT